jgi:acyl-CoA synthetase (AMP-forming)/AMP-acid ligase II
VFGPDGFYPTADRGVLDRDGHLWYRGRLDDMFKVKGATVYPTEVVAALRDVPGVSDAFVTDLVDGDGTRQVAALVVAGGDGYGDDRFADLVAQASTRLSSFKVPTRWLVLPDAHLVPRLASGKVDVHALRQLLRDDGVTIPGNARTV